MTAKQRRFERRRAEHRASLTWGQIFFKLEQAVTSKGQRYVTPTLSATERRFFTRHPKVLEDQLAREFEEIYRADTKRQMEQAMSRQVQVSVPERYVPKRVFSDHVLLTDQQEARYNGVYSRPGLILHPQDFDDLIRAEARTNAGRITHEVLYGAQQAGAHGPVEFAGGYAVFPSMSI